MGAKVQHGRVSRTKTLDSFSQQCDYSFVVDAPSSIETFQGVIIMTTMFKAKFRANGVTYYINTRSEEKRDRAAEFHRRSGIDVEVYQSEVAAAAPEAAVVEQAEAEAHAAGGGAPGVAVAESPF